MPTPFLSTEEYDERAHQLYNEGQYDEALEVLREGLMLYPNAVELHVGVGYAQLAREEYAWARRSFEQALVLEPEHEDGLAGLGETLLKLGQDDAAQRCFHRTLELGYADDVDLMLQVGRSLFREGSLREKPEFFESAKEFFETAVQQVPDSAEAVACVGYTQHRLGDDDAAIGSLRRSLQLDSDHAEARGQLELFGSLLSSLAEQKHEPEHHHIVVSDGAQFGGSWEEIVCRLRDETGNPSHSVEEFMSGVSQHGFRKTGVRIPTHDA